MKNYHQIKADWHAIKTQPSFHKIVLIMKTTCLLLLFSTGNIEASLSYAQSTKLSLTMTNTSIEKVLERIESQSEFQFYYNSKLVNTKRKVSVNVIDKEVFAVLDQVFAEGDIDYKVVDKDVILTQKNHHPSAKETKEAMPSQEGNKKIAGTIIDQNGEAIIGASIVVKGTSLGTVSDMDGRFELNTPPNAKLLISYIGYNSQELTTTGKTSLNITLVEDTKALDEVIVVGYGVQKKANLTGSVSSVKKEDILKRPVSNTTSALQGLVSGLQIIQGTGMPGQESMIIKLRGSSSWGTSSNPLVLIDGVEGSLSNLSATDIENVSVLKDAASASIYGSRAANGVILITTKQGSPGKAIVSYSTSLGVQSATAKPDQIWNSVDYMNLFNKSIDRNTQSGVKYSDDLINTYKNPNRNKSLYPDFNWADAVFETAFQQIHNLGVNGGSDALAYNISTSYLNQEGILVGHDYERYNGLINLTSKINTHVKVGVQGNFVYANTRMPRVYNEGFVLMAQVQAPMYGPYLPDGSGRYVDKLQPVSSGGPTNVNRNPFWIANETYEKQNNWKTNLQAWIDISLLKQDKMSLIWSNKVATRYDDFFRRYYSNDIDTYYWFNEENGVDINKSFLPGNPFGAPDKGVQNRNDRILHTTLFSTLTYNWTVGNQDIAAVLGYSQEKYNTRYLGASRNEFPIRSMEELDGMGINGLQNYGGASTWTMRSVFGRLNYAYQSKYLTELNFRYDQSSYFHKDNRGGFFPSGSLAWRISEESFIKNNLPWLDNLKVRGSYGVLGNNQVGGGNYYNYQEVYNTTTYPFNETLEQGVVMDQFSNKDIKWEETKITNIGLDASVFNGLFSLTADFYNKYTSGILARASIPASAGLDAPVINYGELKNYGIEFDVRHNNKIGLIDYGLYAQISFNRDKVMRYPAPSYGRRIIEEGKPYNDYYLYEYIGVIKDQTYIDNITQWPNGKPQIGDFMIKDQLTVDTNGDGILDAPDGKINDDDRVRMKGTTPDFTYSFGGNFAYKDLDFSFFFQGVEGQKVWTNFFGKDPFSQGSSPNPIFLNAYDPISNPNSNVPSIYAWGYAPSMIESSYHLNNASYMRLKNVQIGYQLPYKIINRAGLQYLRIYLSGDNLLTFTNYPDLDPERAEDGWHTQYPQLKTISFGLNLKF